jgi:hypothetical protein
MKSSIGGYVFREAEMDVKGKRLLGEKAFRLAEVSDRDWQKIMPKYWTETKVWWLVPTAVWVALLIAGVCPVLFDWHSLGLRIVGLALALVAAGKLGGRIGQTDGFCLGYDLGRWHGVCRGLGIEEKDQEELYLLARGLVYETEPAGPPSVSQERPSDRESMSHTSCIVQ